MTYNDCITILEKDELVNIVLLKHALCLRDAAHYFQIDSSIAIRFRPGQMPHDRVLYPDYATITIVSETTRIPDFLLTLERGKHVIKVNGFLPDPTFRLMQSFASLTTKHIISNKHDYSITHETNVDSDHYKYLFGLIQYSIDDVKNMIDSNSAYVLSIKINEIPACSCIVYQVYDRVWEIGALSTAENSRRQHLAEALVSYATNHLLLSNRIPRYHVNMSNLASYRLAVKCGYEPFLHFNHYCYNKM